MWGRLANQNWFVRPKTYIPECLHLFSTANIQAVVFYSKLNILILPLSVNDMKHATVLSGVHGQLDKQASSKSGTYTFITWEVQAFTSLVEF